MDKMISLLDPHGLFSLLHYAWSFFVVLSVIVFIHEFGHYIIAKWCGVKIEVFSIGFGKELLGRTDKSGTRWKLSLVPLGGYVKMFGDASAASTPDRSQNAAMTEEEKRFSFHHKPLWQKAAVVLAGPIFNFLLTIVILTGLILSNGIASTAPVVGEILPDTPAARSQLVAGDKIIAVNGQKVSTFNDIPRLIATNLSTPVDLLIGRGKAAPFHVTLTPEMKEDKDALGNVIKRPLIGIKSQPYEKMELSFPLAVKEAVIRTYQICQTTLGAVGQIISGERKADELKGPIGIAKLSGQATQMDFYVILWFIAMISANLGLVNLFPIPMLDGGHLLYYAIEAGTGRPVAEKIQEFGFKVGFALLACLMVFTILNDLRTIF